MCRYRIGVWWLKLLLASVVVVNTYFIYLILKESSESKRPIVINIEIQNDSKNSWPSHQKATTMKHIASNKKKRHLFASSEASIKILQRFNTLNSSYHVLHREYISLLHDLLEDMSLVINKLNSKVWDYPKKWPTTRQVFPQRMPELGSIVRYAKRAPIIRAENTPKGTQLKILLTLEGGQKAFFKPQWYARDEVITGDVYSGKDRHNAEIAAFHLARLLNLNLVPLVTGRKINLKREVISVAAPSLRKTFISKGHDVCFYGKCYYCKPDDPVCGKGNVIEGALILHLPANATLIKYRHPWQRTYKIGSFAKWEIEQDYCKKLVSRKAYQTGPRLLDLISTSVFDFLIDNGDRHHYEVLGNSTDAAIILIDNGKSFGNPGVDHLDILAPLYQCCILRESLWKRLLQLSGTALSQSMRELLSSDSLYPVLADDHLKAMDRRLLKIFATVEWCLQTKSLSEILHFNE